MRKKYVILTAVILLISAVLCGCGEKKQPEGTFSISYLDKDQTKIVRMAYEPNADASDTELLVNELINVLSTKRENAKTADATLAKFIEYSGYSAISFIQNINLVRRTAIL